MSAGRSASKLLFTAISTLVLFVIFVAISNVKALANYAYAPGFGWETQQMGNQSGVCDRPLTTKGFPLTTSRPANPANDPSGCLDETNPWAKNINLALCFAVAAIVSVGEASVIKRF